LLDACALEAKTLGFSVLRATAGAAREPFSTVQALLQHLLEALSPSELDAAPAELFNGDASRASLRNLADRSLDAEQLQLAVVRFWLNISRKRTLLIAVDDVQRIDAHSAAVLAALLDKSRRAGIFVALSAASDAPASEASAALARRCGVLQVEPLAREETHRLLGSLFGDTANLDMLAGELHAISAGNPRECMDAAQHLVDRGVIRYASGTWTLPNRLASADLPRDAGATKRARLELLSAGARCLAECQALAFYESLRDADYRALLPAASSGEVEEATMGAQVDALRQAQLLQALALHLHAQ
jgi:predicted ATPase